VYMCAVSWHGAQLYISRALETCLRAAVSLRPAVLWASQRYFLWRSEYMTRQRFYSSGRARSHDPLP
jgi:hypothetical protein